MGGGDRGAMTNGYPKPIKTPKKITPPTEAEVLALSFRQIYHGLAACRELTETAAAQSVVLTKYLRRIERGLTKRRRKSSMG